MNLSFTSFKEWLASWRPAIASSPLTALTSVTLRRNYGDELASAGRPTEAAAIYADILRSHPDDIPTYINIGSLCGSLWA